MRFLSISTLLRVAPLDPADLIGSVSVEEIDYIVHEHGVSDAFMGLILVPLVEKAAEHLTGKISSCPCYHNTCQQNLASSC